MRVLEMNITPGQAQKWLNKNDGNRKVRENHVNFLAKQMLVGEWKLNGETIKLNDYKFIDGQHRLLACIKANKPFQSLVAFDVDDDVFDTVDTGEIRRYRDIFSINGEVNVTVLVSVTRISLSYSEHIDKTSKSTFLTGYRKKRSNQEMEKYLESKPELRIAASKASSQRCPFITPAIFGGAYSIFADIDEDDANSFLKSLVNGVGLYEGSPILLIRNKLINAKAKQQTINFETKLAIIIKAWNHERAGSASKRIHWTSAEPFPIAK